MTGCEKVIVETGHSDGTTDVRDGIQNGRPLGKQFFG
ncbi:hypothetical protein GGR03_000310 [Aurantimonas endophytica]|uniref:Uncharacterized protein n=1 Tax=Aurantimonas endophytica TaxID=1522175 RepID=A0A7W6MMX1_9HYPH|nr:hypothetical protein [Aurantimonas endophytica]